MSPCLQGMCAHAACVDFPRCHTLRVTRRIRDRLRRQEGASEWPLMPTVRWQDKAQVVSLRRSRLEHAAVEVAVVFRTPEGRYVHRRMRCSGSDLKSGLGHLFDSQPRDARLRR